MKNTLISLICLLFCIMLTCAQNKDSKFDEEQLLNRLEILSSDKFEGRETGEKGSDSARTYIINQFKNFDVSGLNGKFEHPFTFETRGKKFNANNILVEIKGTQFPDKYIVISAHHDHLGIYGNQVYNGADDDASGVSALISFADYFTTNPPRHSVILAAFDAEELGLRGSKHFVATFDNSKILLNLNMDMISRSTENELYVAGARYNKKLKALLDDFNSTSSTKLLEGHDGTDGKQDWTTASDHGSFHKVNIPFLYFGNEDHESYHQPTDDFEAITPQFYKNSVNLILSVFELIDASGL